MLWVDKAINEYETEIWYIPTKLGSEGEIMNYKLLSLVMKTIAAP